MCTVRRGAGESTHSSSEMTVCSTNGRLSPACAQHRQSLMSHSGFRSSRHPVTVLLKTQQITLKRCHGKTEHLHGGEYLQAWSNGIQHALAALIPDGEVLRV